MFYIYCGLSPRNLPVVGWRKVSSDESSASRSKLIQSEDIPILWAFVLPRSIAGAIASISLKQGARISLRELASMLRDLSVMARAGVPILDAISFIADDGNRDAARSSVIARRLLDDLHAGVSITEAVDRQPDVFSPTVKSLVLVGNESGTLDAALAEAAEHLDRVRAIKSDAGQALVYPAVVFASILGAGAFWLYYVIPKMGELFKQMNAALPTSTVIALQIADWFSNNYAISLLGLTLLGISPLLAWRVSGAFRDLVWQAAHKVPICRKLVEASGLAFFCEYLALLSRSGVNLNRSLAIVEGATSDTFYRKRIAVLRENVAEGNSIGFSMGLASGFPRLMVRMISVGEQSGCLDSQLQYLANEYRNRLSILVKSLSELITPALVLLAGGLFLVLISVFLVPVYDLVRQSLAVR
ncbi:type II secretion system F family protein [Piscinibacter aquaticus]|uniref:Type II secretion system F family protein n=1 Tax=Piscinibacter aquaticus TaxID=392597 RepID=A0A5C6TPH7_9BURK|nr:type II secretion system F family protein [Piscinibacter aquaticus]